MSVFQKSFFSLSGQKERFTNVKDVFAISLNPRSKDKVTSNLSSPTLKAGTEFVANNPYSTAAILATAGSSAGRTAVVNSVSKLSAGTKFIGAGVALFTAPLLATSSRARTTAINVASKVTPEKLVKGGARTGELIENPSVQGAKDLAKENYGVLVGAGAAALLLGGPAVFNAVATAQNTQAVRQNTSANETNVINVPKSDAPNITINIPPTPLSPSPVNAASPTPLAESKATVAPPAAVAPVPKKRKTAKKKPKKTKKNIKKKPKKKKNVRSKPRKKAKKASKKKPKARKKTTKNSRKKT